MINDKDRVLAATRSDKELFPSDDAKIQKRRASTTFWKDFSSAEQYGVDAVKELFAQSFGYWKSDVRHLTELAVVTNRKSWMHAGAKGNPSFIDIYVDAFRTVESFVYGATDGKVNFKKSDRDFFFNVTD